MNLDRYQIISVLEKEGNLIELFLNSHFLTLSDFDRAIKNN